MNGYEVYIEEEATMKEILKSKFSQNTLWLIGGRVYQMMTNLLVSVLMARYLGPSNYGLINYAASWTALFTSVCTLGINSILVNELLQNEEHEGTILGSAIGMRLASCALSSVTIVALSAVLNPGDPTTVWIVAIYSGALVFQAFDTINYWYQAHMRSRVIAVVAMIGYTAVTLYKVVLLVTQQSVAWFAASHIVEYAVVAVLLVFSYCCHANARQRLRFSLKTGKDLLRRSYHFILSGMMVAVYGQMDKIMLKSMLDDAAVGCYSAALAVCSMWPFVISAVIDAARPIILSEYSRNYEKYKRLLTILYGAIIYVSLAVGTLITVCSGLIIRLLYGDEYMVAREALCIVTWYTAFSYLGVARSIWLVPHNQIKYEKYIAGCGAMANLCFNAVMIPLWGINGAAVATLSTQIFTNFVVGFFIRDIRENNRLILNAMTFWRYLK